LDLGCHLAGVSAAVGQEPWKQPDARELRVETRVFGQYEQRNLCLTERGALFRVPINFSPAY